MSKERYLSKEEYKEYEKYKNDKKKGRLLNPEGLIFLAESVDFDAKALGDLMLENAMKFKEENPFLTDSSSKKLIFNVPSEESEESEDFIPFIEFRK